MAEAVYDFVGAKQSGLTDQQIVDEIAPTVGYDHVAARAGGITDQQILGELGSVVNFGTRPDSIGDKLGRVVSAIKSHLPDLAVDAPIDITAPQPKLRSVAEAMNSGDIKTAKDVRDAVAVSKKYDPENSVLPGAMLTAQDANRNQLQSAQDLSQAPRREQPLESYSVPDALAALAMTGTQGAPRVNGPLREAGDILSGAAKVPDHPLARFAKPSGDAQSVLGISTPNSAADIARTRREYVDKPLESMAASAGQAASMAGFPVAAAADALQGGDYNKEGLTRSIEDFTQQKQNAAPDQSVGFAGHMIRAIEELAPLVAAGPAGVPLIAAEGTVSKGVDLADKGVTGPTNAFLSALAGGVSYAFTQLPFSGKSMASSLVRGATMNPALGMVHNLAEKETLKATDYDTIADSIKVVDPDAMPQDIAMGLLFGYMGGKGKPLKGKTVAEDLVPFWDTVKDSTWFRKMTIPERNLVVQDIGTAYDAMMKAGVSEAAIAKMGADYFQEALRRRSSGEVGQPTHWQEMPPEAPVVPEAATPADAPNPPPQGEAAPPAPITVNSRVTDGQSSGIVTAIDGKSGKATVLWENTGLPSAVPLGQLQVHPDQAMQVTRPASEAAAKTFAPGNQTATDNDGSQPLVWAQNPETGRYEYYHPDELATVKGDNTPLIDKLDFTSNDQAFDPARLNFELGLLKNPRTSKTAVLVPNSAGMTVQQVKQLAADHGFRSMKEGGDFYIYDSKQIKENDLRGQIRDGKSGQALGYGTDSIPKNGIPYAVDLDGHGTVDPAEILQLRDTGRLGFAGIAPDVPTAVAKIREMGRDDADVRGKAELADQLVQRGVEKMSPTDHAGLSHVEDQEAAGPQRGKIGDMLAGGETRLTASGRETTPFPKVATDTDRKTRNTLKSVDAWLWVNGKAEAAARGDEFNATQFGGWNPKKLSQADKDSLEQYLFGDEQPPVVPSILKPLIDPGAERKALQDRYDKAHARAEEIGTPGALDAQRHFEAGKGEIEDFEKALDAEAVKAESKPIELGPAGKEALVAMTKRIGISSVISEKDIRDYFERFYREGLEGKELSAHGADSIPAYEAGKADAAQTKASMPEQAKERLRAEGFDPDKIKVLSTPEEVIQHRKEYGPPNSVPESADAKDTFNTAKTGMLFIDDETGEPVAYASPDLRGPGSTTKAADLGGLQDGYEMVDGKPEPKTAQDDFPAWFDGSKVVGEDGKPLVMYHGTRAKFDKFDTAKAGDANGVAVWGPGTYFIDSEDGAKFWGNQRGKFSDARAIPAYLSLKNPIIISDAGVHFSEGDIAAYKKEGKDGVIYQYGGNILQAVAWSPEQIRVAEPVAETVAVKKEATAARSSKAKKTTEASKKIDREKDDIIVAISKLGGMDLAEAQGQWGDVVRDSRKTLANHVLAQTKRFGAVFKKEGRSLDKMRESLVGHGYLPEGADIEDLYDAIELATKGQFKMSDEHSVESDIDREAREYEERMMGALDDDVLDAVNFNDFTEDEASYFHLLVQAEMDDMLAHVYAENHSLTEGEFTNAEREFRETFWRDAGVTGEQEQGVVRSQGEVDAGGSEGGRTGGKEGHAADVGEGAKELAPKAANDIPSSDEFDKWMDDAAPEEAAAPEVKAEDKPAPGAVPAGGADKTTIAAAKDILKRLIRQGTPREDIFKQYEALRDKKAQSLRAPSLITMYDQEKAKAGGNKTRTLELETETAARQEEAGQGSMFGGSSAAPAAKKVATPSLVKTPAGTFTFAGAVPDSLRYQKVDGSGTPSAEVLQELRQSSNPAMVMKARGVKTVSFPTAQGALDAATAAGVKVQNAGDFAPKKMEDHILDAVMAGKDAVSEILKGITDPNKLGSGPNFDDETYEKLKPHFQRMWDAIKAAGFTFRDAAQAFAKQLMETYGKIVKPFARKFYETLADIEKRGSEDGKRGDLEPDSRDAETKDIMGAEDVQPRPAADAGRPLKAVQDSEGAKFQPGGDPLLPRLETTPPGERGDQRLHNDEAGSRSEAGAAGSDERERGADPGDEGPPVESVATSAVTQAARRPVQEKVEAAKGSVEADVPQLHPGQADDVRFAEARFAKPDGHGVLFTNGTGTGKTFTGLGIAKRFALQGKDNILILAPNQDIIDSWINSGKIVSLDIKRLLDIKDNGKRGAVITTYKNAGDNNALASRKWDLIINDEADNLSANKDGELSLAAKTLQAITLHPDGVSQRAQSLNPDLVQELQRLGQIKNPTTLEQMKQDKLASQWRDAVEKTRAEVAAGPRSKVVFLSATPFAYEKSTHYANGYLFDYGPEPTDGRYNSGSARDRFMMQHFGYRMRTGKLTEPPPEVDRGIMQRQFNGWLKQQGVLAGRVLDVDSDYDRKFVLVDSAIGNQIDEGLKYLRENKRYDLIYGVIMKKFDHLSRRYLLEAIKANEVIPLIKQHLALSRQVVVFHDFNQGGGFNPFDVSRLAGNKTKVTFDDNGRPYLHTVDAGPGEMSLGALVREFMADRRDLIELPLASMPSPLVALRKAFPDLLVINGTEKPKDRRAAINAFQDDGDPRGVILVQSAAGKAGISLHDTTGKRPRVTFNLGLPTTPVTSIQQEGRTYRIGQASNAMFRYLNTGTNWERFAFATTIADRASTTENLALGESARALKDAFIEGFEDSDRYPAGFEGEGTGGKERDRLANAAITEWDRAMAMYFSQRKGRQNHIGTDYFATPEPLGLKMVEWAEGRAGDAMLEPSMGHGAIARWFPEDAKRRGIEPSLELASKAALVFDGDIVQGQFEDHNIVNKYDAIVMNPPFGTAGRTAIDHLAKASKHLKEGGRVVALIPDGPAANAKFDKWLYEEAVHPVDPIAKNPRLGAIYAGDTAIISKGTFGDGSKGVITRAAEGAGRPSVYVKVAPAYRGAQSVTMTFEIDKLISIEPTGKREKKTTNDMQLVADYKLPTVTFERAGTKAMTRIVVLDKGTGHHQVSRDWTDEDTIKGFFDRIKDATVPQRNRPEPEESEAPAPKSAKAGLLSGRDSKLPDRPSPQAAEDIAAAQFNHTKTGAPIFVATVKKKLGDVDFKAAVSLAKQYGGHYSGFNGAGAIRGFHFETAAKRDAFVGEMSGKDAAPPSSSGVMSILGNERGAIGRDLNVTNTPAFKNWFGDSKVVDSAGKPLVVYHGTMGDFDTFEAQDSGYPAFYFTPKKGDAKRYANAPKHTAYGRKGPAKVLEAYLSLQNPKVVAIEESFFISDGEVAAAKAEGHDGIIGTDKGKVVEYIAFDATQIKSIHNRGTFDPNDPNILHDITSVVPLAVKELAKIAKAGKEAVPHLVDMGKEAYRDGATTFKAFSDRMKTWLGDLWDRFKIQAKGVFDHVARILKDERGSFSTKMARRTSGQPEPKGFIDEDLKPAMATAAKTIMSSLESFRRTFTAASRSELSRQTALNLRELASIKARHLDQIANLIEPARKYFDRHGGSMTDTNSRSFRFIEAVELGTIDTLPAIEEPFAQINHIIFDNLLRQIRDRGKLQGTKTAAEKQAAMDEGRDFETFYFPRLWKEEKEAIKVYLQLVAKSPFDGRKAFMKQRTIQLYRDGIEAGLVPAYDNPMDMIYHKAAEMETWIMAKDWVNKERAAGRVIEVPAGHSAPEGMIQLQSNIGTIYGGNAVPVWKMLRELAKSSKKDLFFEDFGKKVFPSALEIAGGADDTMKREANSLRWDTATGPINIHAMHRGTGRSYSELIIDKMLQNHEAFQQEAPAIFAELEQIANNRPKIQQIMDMPTFEDLQTKLPVGGMIVKAHLFAPEAAASVFNNLVSKGLRSNDAFRAYLGAANVLNQFQLGMSLFHAGFTSVDAAVSSGALGVMQASHGQVLKAIRSFAESPIAPVTNAIRGHQMLKEWDTPGSTSPEIAGLIAASQAGGARARMDKFYHTEITKKMLQTFRGGTLAQKIFMGVGRIPFALVEQSAKPVLEWLVPRQKMGIISAALKYEMERNPNMTHEEMQAIAAEIVDSVDNRMGQLIYDNLFWNKITKDLAMATVRSVGWNLGTIREIGGGVVDTGVQGGRVVAKVVGATAGGKVGQQARRVAPPRMTHKMSYLIALPILVGLAGAITQYLATGLVPGDTDPAIKGDIGSALSDLFNPRIGGMDKHGKPRRVVLPSYMKDIFHYAKDAPGTIVAKLHPILSMVGEMLRNKDYYGVEIRHKDDGAVKQALQLAEHGAKKFIPYAISGMVKNISEGAGPIETILPEIGITPSSSDVNKTPAEKLAEEMIRERLPAGSRTKEEYEATQKKAQVVRAMKMGEGQKAKTLINELIKNGDLNQKQLLTLIDRSNHSYLYNLVKSLEDYQSVNKVYELANDAEKKQIEALVKRKEMNAAKANPIKYNRQLHEKP